MKVLFVLFFSIFLRSWVSATPDYQESTTEDLIGANETSYAVRRIERNNQGSYYVSQATVYLDEYSVDDGRLIQSRLLVDRMIRSDAMHSDPNTRPVNNGEVIKKNDKIILADIYEKYFPVDGSYHPDWLREIKLTEDGIIFRNRLLVSKFTIDKLYQISFNHGRAIPKLLSVQHSGDCVYFKVTTRRSENGVSNKIICLSALDTKRLNGWAHLQPIYLNLSTHSTLVDANKRALALQEVLKENKLHYRLEIWSKRLKTDKMAYYVVHESSSYLMKKNKVEGLNRVLNTTAVPIVSGGFRDRWFPDVLLSIKKN